VIQASELKAELATLYLVKVCVLVLMALALRSLDRNPHRDNACRHLADPQSFLFHNNQANRHWTNQAELDIGLG
jgi:hypothetical protein